MLIPDVNVLVYAFHAESPRHAEYREWLLKALAGPEIVGVSELVLSGLVRVVTNHRIFDGPASTAAALAFCDALLDSPGAIAIRPTDRHWATFRTLCLTVGATGNLAPDAYHAALAIDHGATWVTNDRGFARFPGLRWALPLGE